MCAERLARIPTIIMVFVILYFVTVNPLVAQILLVFVGVMMTIWATFDFCPSIFILKKFLPSCYCECEEKKENDG
jgi:hypothetical protein